MNPVDLLIEIIREHSTKSKWTDAPLEGFRRVANTNRGEIGEAFIRRYLHDNGIMTDNGSRVTPTDMTIANSRFEIKTASEDVGGNFQFNHIRFDRNYHYLLCLAIFPSAIRFNCWSKGDVAEGKAGMAVRMAEGQSVTFKLTKRPRDLHPIEKLPDWMREHLSM